jgi:hypothetical protein
MALAENDRIGRRGRAGGFPDPSRGLPRRLPADRCLAHAFIGLTISILAVSPALAGPAQNWRPAGAATLFDLAAVYDGCGIAEGRLTADAIARVLRILSDEEKANVIARNEAYYGAKVNPLYLPNARVLVQRPNSAPTIAVAPRNWQGQPGDIVVIKGAYRDPALPCHFVPPMIQGSVPLS